MPRSVGFAAPLLATMAALFAIDTDGLVSIARAVDAAHGSAVVPLEHAHAHNDYEHKRPLFDALDHGFCSVEADVFLIKDQLLVGHTSKDLRPERTLEKLYLDPLRERIRSNQGRLYRNGPFAYLLIDVKTEAKATYAALDKVLARYADILSVTRHGKFEQKGITAVVSGNRAQEVMAAQEVRYAGIDGRTTDLDSEVPADLMPWISGNWGFLFHWRGAGPIPANDRAKLLEFVRKAHQHGRKLRFWATPERVEVWKELQATGVDLINTDKLADLQRFFLHKE
ncbi:MAG TPA: phosphatidylinositol-specific phospholipase C/glycerophosphodiester phosphodiesterase family protein [Gemmataceae bacterium]|nr:phosphatidylinositol-specific phospholipase C/glycerophosphodiester phosphodiesterase family protein [Gemmataceae bacterium]